MQRIVIDRVSITLEWERLQDGSTVMHSITNEVEGRADRAFTDDVWGLHVNDQSVVAPSSILAPRIAFSGVLTSLNSDGIRNLVNDAINRIQSKVT